MGNAGKVDFPAHMKTIHQEWLNDTGTDVTESSMVDAMNAVLGASPYASMSAYNPTTPLAAMDTVISTFATLVSALSFDTDWQSIVDIAVSKADGGVFDDTYISTDVQAFADELDDQIESIVLPRFQGGMRDVNAIMSSAFVIGKSIIEGFRDRDVSKYNGDLRVKLNIMRNDFIVKGIAAMLHGMFSKIELTKTQMHYTMESNRLEIAAQKDKTDAENQFLVQNLLWDIEVFQYGGNLLASIGGGTFVPKSSSGGPSTAQSAIGGALGGAAAGAAIGGPAGALIGGVLGGLAGLFS